MRKHDTLGQFHNFRLAWSTDLVSIVVDWSILVDCLIPME